MPDLRATLNVEDGAPGATDEDGDSLKEWYWTILLGRQPPGKTLTCPHCGKVDDTLWKHKRHLLTHTDDRPFECEVCFKTFSQEAAVKTHREGVHDRAKKRGRWVIKERACSAGAPPQRRSKRTVGRR